MESYVGLTIDLSKDKLFTEQALMLLKGFYLADTETSPQQAFARAAVAYSGGDMLFAQRIYDYASKGWFMFASPVLSNAPLPGAEVQALPISCFLTSVPDNLEGIISHSTELRWMSVKGGGLGGYWGDIRAVSTKSPGPLPFIRTVDADMSAYKQGQTRKGSYAAYLDVSHPDIIEFIQMRIPTGDLNRKCLNLFNAVNIPDSFMHAVLEDSTWNLVDPKTKAAQETLKARELWRVIQETRYRTGTPYLNFIDTVNEARPEPMKKAGLKVRASNLCNEIHLPTDNNHSQVCCLSSVNLAKFEEWRNTQMVEDLIRFLDNVMQFFIDHTKVSKVSGGSGRNGKLGPVACSGVAGATLAGIGGWAVAGPVGSAAMAALGGLATGGLMSLLGLASGRKANQQPNVQAGLAKARAAAIRDRPLGLGAMGWHSLLQSKGLAFESEEALKLNQKVFQLIKLKAVCETRRLASERGECPIMSGTGRRNSHLLAIAPNANSSIILKTSPSIEPWSSNAFVHRTRAGAHLIKNPHLTMDLEKLNLNTPEIWNSIKQHEGSVQHLSHLLPAQLLKVYKTAFEINQTIVVRQAADRQRYLCQGQSLNTFFNSEVSIKEFNDVAILGWALKVKGFYYIRTKATQRVEKVDIKVEKRTKEHAEEHADEGKDCRSCQG
jgi:ribonucleotide reductase alpha subunit